MKIYTLNQLLPLLHKGRVIEAVRQALIAHARGEVQSPMPGSLMFPEANGDCHIKFGQMRGSDHFAIKVATGFYDNPKHGLLANNGLVMVLSATTGQPTALFLDEGWLTAWRTAAATALAALVYHPAPNVSIGIVGAGLQAKLAAVWIAELSPGARFSFQSRNAQRARAAAEEVGGSAVSTIEELLGQSDIVITATPSPNELFDAQLVRPGMHFVGLGADGPEKAELPAALFARAHRVLVDCAKQCLALSDYGRAVRSELIAPEKATHLGSTLAEPTPPARSATEITVVDLTGLAAQDIAIANVFAKSLGEAGL